MGFDLTGSPVSMNWIGCLSYWFVETEDGFERCI